MYTVRFDSSRGNALVGALVAVGISGIVTMSAIGYNNAFIHTSRVAYVRAAFSTLESNIRFMAMQPYAYDCGAQGTVNTQLGGLANCKFRTNAQHETYFKPVESITFPGAQCEPGVKDCGFSLKNLKLTPTPTPTGLTGVFSATLSYDGKEISLAPSNITLTVPTDVLQSQTFDCATVDATKPVFAGFDSTTGAPICRGFADCPTGQYVKSLNFKNMTRVCGSLAPENDKLNCLPAKSGLDQPMIRTMQWSNGVVSSTCAQVDIPPAVPAPVKPVTPNPPKPPQNCADITYNDPQPIVFSASSISLTSKFQSAVDKIQSGCTYSSVDVDYRWSGVSGATCNYSQSFKNMVPGSPARSAGFLGGKSTYTTAVVNGGEAYITGYTSGYSTGALAYACISNVVITVHSKAN